MNEAIEDPGYWLFEESEIEINSSNEMNPPIIPFIILNFALD